MKIIETIRTYWIALTIIILLAITILSLSPLEKLPEVPSSDKAHHFIAYAVLVFPTAFRRPRGWLLIAFSFIVYSGLIELIQPYVNRYGEWNDLLANAGGIACGIIVAMCIRYISLWVNNKLNIRSDNRFRT